MLQIASFYEDF